MISTEINAGQFAGNGQMMEMLSVITSSPEVYSQRLKDLQEATEQNRKMVELVAPASDIISLRDRLRIELASASAALTEAKSRAEAIFSEAREAADAMIASAEKQAESMMAEAKAALHAARSDQARAAGLSSSVKKEREKYQAMQKDLEASGEELAGKIALAEAAKAEAEEAKAAIIAKHEAFLAELLG